ncbi:MAG TPA: YetF domain-containing protein [Methyloceanibacter sp.]|nr:YetF domain-containing protein [Methyloceanibacter sp.]
MEAMRAQRVTKEEVEAALRENGTSNVSQADCVVLETDGSLSVIQTHDKASSKDKL